MSTFQPAPKPGYGMDGKVVSETTGQAKQKRFLVFAGSNYYPMGGWFDCIGSADTAEDALAAAEAAKEDWTQVIDLETGEEVG